MLPVTDTIEISALHEAAHCVLKWRLGCDFYDETENSGFRLIAIRSETEIASGPYVDSRGRRHECSGISEMPCFYAGVDSLDDTVPDFVVTKARRKLRHDIMVMLAGPLAEARARHCAVEPLFERPQAGFQDWQRVLQTICRMNLPSEQHSTVVSELRAQTEEYLSDPKVWHTIVVLAQAVVVRSDRRLTGRDAFPILEDAWRSQGQNHLQA